VGHGQHSKRTLAERFTTEERSNKASLTLSSAVRTDLGKQGKLSKTREKASEGSRRESVRLK
jgi:uncharacterized alpha/beta hydrolase family protein